MAMHHLDDNLNEKEEKLRERLEKLDSLEKEIKAREKAIKSRENAKKQVLLRLPQGLWEAISQWADDDFRSINGQIEYLLTEAVRNRRKGKG